MMPTGSRLGGYEIVGLVGRGGMGEVYRAKQLSMEREVALKILAPRLAKDPVFAEQFVAEARAAGKLNHPNIVGVHDVAQAQAPEGCSIPAGEAVHYFSMEFIDGETVKDVIERQGAVDLPTVGKVMAAMAEALSFAEAHKIVHRDIKPDNIMLTSAGLVKLADLGLALLADSTEAVAGSKDEQGRGKVMGTPLYMAPEQARAHPLDHRADQYALGATLFHMLTGRAPYQGESAKAIMRAHCFDPVADPAEVNPQVPPPWRELCMRMMAKTPEERFAGATELKAAIKAAVRWKPGSSLRTREMRAGGSGPSWVGIAIITAAAVAGLFFFALRPSSPPVRQPDPTPTPGPNLPDPHTAVRARAAQELAALPDEPGAALAQVELLLADPALGPARDLLTRRRDSLRAAIEERRRNSLRAAADAIDKTIAAGQLGEARDGLARLPDEPWLGERRRRLLENLAAGERSAEARFNSQIDAAADAAACDQLAGEVARAPLTAERRQALTARIDRRRKEIAARTPVKVKPDVGGLWRALGERTQPMRGSMPYSNLAEAFRSGARAFPDEERVQIEALAAFTDLAQQAETALRLHIGQATPKADCRFGSRTGVFILTRLEKDWIGFRLVDVPAESRADRASAVVPWPQLLATGLTGPEGPRQTAAFLWFWRQPNAQAAVAKLKDDALSLAIATYERRTRPIDIAGEVERREGGQLAFAYPFAAVRDKTYLEAWQGPAEITDRGLRWTTTQLVAAGSKAEAELPVLRWKSSLHAPLTLEATMQPEAGSDITLIGLTSGGVTLRVGLNPKNKAFILATRADDAASYEALSAGQTLDYNPNEWTRIRLVVDAAGKVTASLNDRPIASPRELAFPADAKLTPILQGRAVKQGCGMVVESLTITGKL